MNPKREIYNRLWEKEWRFLHNVGPSVRSRHRILLKFFHKYLQEGLILDSGCGDGIFLRLLYKDYGNRLQYEGADISDVAINRVRQMRFVQAAYIIDLEKIELFPQKKYTAVVSSEVLEHIRDWKLALHNLSTLLKPNGILFISVPHGMKYWSANDDFANHYRRFEIGQIESELKKSGYEILESICWGFPTYWLYYTIFLNHSDPSKNMNMRYSAFKKIFSDFLYLLFRMDDIFNNTLGRRLFIVARKKEKIAADDIAKRENFIAEAS